MRPASSIAFSADGRRAIATASGAKGGLWLSRDGGLSWQALDRIGFATGREWQSAQFSPDGEQALAIASGLGVAPAAVAAGLADFRGVVRRFEFRGERDGVAFVDDYAHLPTEVAAAIATARRAREEAGLALGTWGAVQASAAGLAVALGGVLRDAIHALSTT